MAAAPPIRHGWCLPRPVRRFGERLMGQQVWCWGQDVEYAGGNLLMRFGFERHRDAYSADRSTCYRLDGNEVHVALWGFGMFFGTQRWGGLYFGRFEFCPKWAPIESLSLAIHWPDELPTFTRPRGVAQWRRSRRLWKSALNWIADYEAWVRAEVGLEYRRTCVATWLRPIVRADKIVAAWRYLGRRGWERCIDHQTGGFQQFTLGMRNR